MSLWSWIMTGIIVIFLLSAGIGLVSLTKAAKKRDSFMNHYNPNAHPPDKKEDDNEPKWW